MANTRFELQGTSIIGFRRGDPGREPFWSVDPKTGNRLEPMMHSASFEEADEALTLAGAAVDRFRRTMPSQRAAFLRMIADGIDARTEELVDRVGSETALPPGRVRSEAGRTSGQLRLFAELVEEGSWVDARIDHGDPSRTPAAKPDIRSMLVPLGPVVVFCASNFPLAFSVAGGDTASAFAAGCPVVVNGHIAHAGTAEIAGLIVQESVRACGLPEGTFSLLFSKGLEIGQALVRHHATRAVGFTGSRIGGLALAGIASKRPVPIPVFAEMSSVNPVVVLPKAMETGAEAIADGFVASLTLGAGQFCTNPGIVFIPAGEASARFVVRLRERVSNAPPQVMLHDGIRQRYNDAVATRGRWMETLAASGKGDGTQIGAEVFMTTAAAFQADHSMQEEIFGPSAIVVTCNSNAELLSALSEMEGQLTATLHATMEDLEENRDLFRLMESKVGRLLVNGFPTGVEVCDSMVHSGPYPATSDGRSTSVGLRSIERFVRPVCYQDVPESLLPPELQEGNPLGIWRRVGGERGKV